MRFCCLYGQMVEIIMDNFDAKTPGFFPRPSAMRAHLTSHLCCSCCIIMSYPCSIRNCVLYSCTRHNHCIDSEHHTKYMYIYTYVYNTYICISRSEPILCYIGQLLSSDNKPLDLGIYSRNIYIYIYIMILYLRFIYRLLHSPTILICT